MQYHYDMAPIMMQEPRPLEGLPPEVLRLGEQQLEGPQLEEP